MDKKVHFIAAAIQDCQETIRATDVKVGALLAGMLLPFAQISNIWKYLEDLSIAIESQSVTVIFLALWFSTIFALVCTISAIDNPAAHIVNEGTCQGAFYGAKLYDFSFLDSFLNRKVVKANKDITNFSQAYPDSINDIELELSFEHMKLMYIREIKLHRLDFALKLSILWFVVGISSFIYFKSIA
ncbi:hypothetical protein [Vibrio sagamiensis]|uniref:Uncharacterized protein n=1 Tax=Vibrio sagamiensis NBRC 104589 TaxID=1219064 RepID=A0A511QK51_9VIBR|nr:hypothetical protein [Vibrio sagamiensis]PNQ55592.1 hypothetical protein C1141_14300 [Vibrio agarivorans]GEM77703.1 hypothetical protein VSA01S_38150 [Vibrio sagamiensis NBRC 104589]